MVKILLNNSIKSVIELQARYMECHSKIKSLLLNDLIKATDDDGYLPTSFDVKSRIYSYDLIREVLCDIGIAPIQIRAIFKNRFDVYHVHLACKIKVYR